MGLNLSIKNVPEDQVERLKLRAKNNHRSLQGELRAVIAEIASLEPSAAANLSQKEEQPLSVDEVIAKIRKLRITPRDDAERMIRKDRDR